MSLDALLTELDDPDAKIHAVDLTSLSYLAGDARERFLESWRRMSVQRRRELIDRLAELTEDNVELDFDAIFLVGLLDDDVQVRAESVKALWEHEEDELVLVLLRLLEDPEAIVRAEAALGLGRFLLRAELDGRDESELTEVRGRAVESIGARSSEWVRDLIEDAYASGDRRLAISAVHAMGRNADPDWLPTIIEEMHSEDSEMRFEAAMAAGGIGDEDAVPDLAELASDEDAEVQEAAIGALGQIGGVPARNVLQSIASESRDDRVLEAVNDALEEAQFTEDAMSLAPLLADSLGVDDEDEDE
ncbi:MAG TPA: HEAT repeat domain-containing protein [Kofleriaceae bacterium]|nr:HEAT repeat domain-containing protein [Kofleriaceae bacterium]